MTDFPKLYCEVILKKIVTKLQRDIKAQERAMVRRLETSTDGNSVRTQRHWKAAADDEFYHREILEGFDRMKELDALTNWSSNLHQDRFKFMKKYESVLKDYKDKIKVG